MGLDTLLDSIRYIEKSALNDPKMTLITKNVKGILYLVN